MHISQPLMAALPENQSNVKAPPSLLTIPGEIRNRIYHHLLSVRRVNVFDCAACCTACLPGETVPDLAILRVNRQINGEASTFFYSTSTFIVSTGRDLACFMSKTDDFCLFTAVTQTFPSRAAIRSLEIRFMADYIPIELHEQRMKELWHSAHFRAETRRRKAKHLHDLDRTASEAVWDVAGELLSMMHGLRNLTVNIEQAFCPEGCCRLVDAVTWSLRGLRRRPEVRINVTGSLDNGEVKTITKAFKRQEARNATSESSTGASHLSSDDRSDGQSDDSTTNDDRDWTGGGSDDGSSNNSGHIGHGDDGIAGIAGSK